MSALDIGWRSRSVGAIKALIQYMKREGYSFEHICEIVSDAWESEK